MKKQFAQKLLYCFLLFIQVGLIIAVFVVNDLSGKKAGVYRHVYTRRMHYMEGLYNPTSIQWQSLLVAWSLYTSHYPFVFFYKKEKGIVLQSSNCFSDSLSFFVIIVMNSEFFISMMAYPYIIMVFEIVLAIQLIVVIALSLKKSKQ